MTDKIKGMKEALWIIEKCEFYDTGDLNAADAATAMKDILTGCLQAHIRAADNSRIDRELAEERAAREKSD